jgi:hypothetical protein
MACGCNKNRATAQGTATASGAPGTYRVYAGTRKVYETTNGDAADQVAARFADARVVQPGVEA